MSSLPAALPTELLRSGGTEHEPGRLTELVKGNFAYVWRLMRRLGLRREEADDAAQRVFMVLAERMSDVAPGHERGFLFRTAINIASKAHRSRERRREDVGAEARLHEHADPSPPPDELVDRERARELLDRILGSMPMDLRVVFVLSEIEQVTMAQIAVALEIPAGTVASRLRRAREDFAVRVARLNRGTPREGRGQ
jgi:RNA polymerase sigma-70 factor, ECF subfamily